MKILGISNPNFIGVTVATKAICTDYYPVPHQQNPAQARNIGAQIAKFAPDIMVVGGWSHGYDILLAELNKFRKFPVICIYHSTLFHGNFFGDEVYWAQAHACQKRGEVDFIGYVQSQTAEYFQKVRKQYGLWVPHYFKQLQPIPKPKVFRIGVLGGTSSWFKNGTGALEVCRDYVNNIPGCDLVTNQTYDKTHTQFLNTVASCSLLVHISHLECYPNTVQEGWSMGVPSILSQASIGLTECPLLNPKEQEHLKNMTLKSNVNAVELYNMISDIHKYWESYSATVHTLHGSLTKRANLYTDKLFEKLVQGYKTRSFDKEFFRMPFEKPEGLWV